MVSPPSISTIVRKVYHIDECVALRIFADQTVRPSLNIVKTFAIFLDRFSGGGGRVKLSLMSGQWSSVTWRMSQ